MNFIIKQIQKPKFKIGLTGQERSRLNNIRKYSRTEHATVAPQVFV